MSTTQPDLADQIREAIKTSGKTYRELGRETGVNYTAIHRFASGGRANITVETADKLMRALGLRVTRGEDA